MLKERPKRKALLHKLFDQRIQWHADCITAASLQAMGRIAYEDEHQAVG